jgi:hypothetical protein
MLMVSCEVKVLLSINLQNWHTELINKNLVESNFEIKLSEYALSINNHFGRATKQC